MPKSAGLNWEVWHMYQINAFFLAFCLQATRLDALPVKLLNTERRWTG
jgi:hypothetical protein